MQQVLFLCNFLKVNEFLTYAMMLDLVVAYVQFVIMLIVLKEVLCLELKYLCIKSTTVLSEWTIPKTMNVSLLYIFLALEIDKYIIRNVCVLYRNVATLYTVSHVYSTGLYVN